MIVNVYYSKKMRKYYFLQDNVMEDEINTITVYGGDKLKGGEIKTDKNGKKYITGIVSHKLGKNGSYYVCEGYYNDKDCIEQDSSQESSF